MDLLGHLKHLQLRNVIVTTADSLGHSSPSGWFFCLKYINQLTLRAIESVFHGDRPQFGTNSANR